MFTDCKIVTYVNVCVFVCCMLFSVRVLHYEDYCLVGEMVAIALLCPVFLGLYVKSFVSLWSIIKEECNRVTTLLTLLKKIFLNTVHCINSNITEH